MANVLATILIFFLPISAKGQIRSPKVVRGVIDISHVDFEKSAPISLNGQWEFYWQKLLSPQDFKDKSTTFTPNFIQVPGSWNMVDDYEYRGYATYRVLIKIGDIKSLLSLHFTGIWSASKIFLDGTEIFSNGEVSEEDSTESYKQEVKDNDYTFKPSQPEIELIIQAANYDIFLAGIATNGPLIGSNTAMERNKLLNSARQFFVVGCLTIIGIYHLCLWSLRSQERSPLFFGLFCLTIAMYLTVGSGARVLRTIFPALGYTGYLRTFNMWILAPMFFAWYVYELFPNYFRKSVAKALTYIFIPFAIYVLLTEPREFVWKTPLIQATTGLFCVYVMYVMYKAIRSHEEGAKLFMIGTIIIMIATFHDMAYSRGLIDSIPLGGIGTLSFVFIQSLLLAKRFSSAFNTIEISEKHIRHLSEDLRIERDHVLELNTNLEGLVEEKIRDIK